MTAWECCGLRDIAVPSRLMSEFRARFWFRSLENRHLGLRIKGLGIRELGFRVSCLGLQDPNKEPYLEPGGFLNFEQVRVLARNAGVSNTGTFNNKPLI